MTEEKVFLVTKHSIQNYFIQNQSYKMPPKQMSFSQHETLSKWFLNLPSPIQEQIRDKFLADLQQISHRVGVLGCQELKGTMTGISTRARDEGRSTFRLFCWVNEKFPNNDWCPKTNGEDKGPEVNLAAIYPTICSFKAHYDDKLVCSHRCNNKRCTLLGHLCWEPQECNNDRNNCRVEHCKHEPKCLANGTCKTPTSDLTFVIEYVDRRYTMIRPSQVKKAKKEIIHL
jgi:hypothetical protein